MYLCNGKTITAICGLHRPHQTGSKTSVTRHGFESHLGPVILHSVQVEVHNKKKTKQFLIIDTKPLPFL